MKDVRRKSAADLAHVADLPAGKLLSGCPSVSIIGTRGIPGRHGGFETFAERLALHLSHRGWQVTVTCQSDQFRPRTEYWNGIRLRHLPQWLGGSAGTMVYDLRSTLETLKPPQVVLLLGYNTALFSLLHRLTGVRCVVNMDGLEWQRPKWSLPVKAWFYFNERIAPKIALRVVADHPVRARDLRNRTTPGRLSMIPYGADAVTEADAALVEKFGLLPDNYLLVVARPEPDNSILEIVQAFSRDRRGVRLCVLGNLDSGRAYHRQVMQAASDEVLFPGACYDRRILEALRFYARFYIHGHRFGGTNPSLVEAMGCGCAVLAHGNPYNRWVAGDAMISFDSVNSCAAAITALLAENTALPGMRVAARSRHSELFTWPHILRSYEDLLLGVL